MSNLSELLPAGGGGKNVNFVASGTLGNGKTVILNSDGTVTGAGMVSQAGIVIPVGSSVVFNNAGVTTGSATSFDPNTAGKFVVAFRDNANSSYGTCIVGTVSGTSISFGSEYIFSTGSATDLSIAFDPNTANKFIVAWREASINYYGTSVVGTISGTSISFGSEVVFNSAEVEHTSASFDPNTANKFVIAYKDGGNGNKGTAIVGTVSGTSISYGSEVLFDTTIVADNALTFDPNTSGKFIIAYRDQSNSHRGKTIVGTLSGTSTSYGTAGVFNTATVGAITASFDPNTANKFVIAYKDAGNSYYGTSIVGTVSGTSISYGSKYVFNAGSDNFISIAFDPSNTGKLIVAYQNGSNSSYGTSVVGTVSGTTISYSSPYIFESSESSDLSASFDPNTSGNFVVAFTQAANSNKGTVILGDITGTVQATNLTATNFLGITDAAISSGASGSVTIKGGLKSELSSLTPNSIYYVQSDGSVTTASTAPAVRIGKALSSTTLNLEFSS